MRTTYYAVCVDDQASLDDPVGLYRRTYDAAGRRTASEAFHPRTGWSPTDYWLQVERGEPEFHLVEVDAGRAQLVEQHFSAGTVRCDGDA